MIKLNAAEVKLFDIFRSFLRSKNNNTTLRVAGGWVRDKLLGKESTDIDIALDNCSGETFAEQLHAFLKEQKMETHGFGVIRKNPEKSKHLETATIQINGSWVDFVNLRGEEYCEDSRIPQIVMGTPESDAFRRDYTINALFYNINEDKVEDFTKRGLSDLQTGFMRTPLNPLQTFLDDPLRILRGFRFAVRFQFQIDPLIFESLAKPQVKDAFVKKISRERIGLEFSANFQKNPDLKNSFEFFGLIKQTGLWPLILDLPPSDQMEAGYANMVKVAQRLEELLSDFRYIMDRTVKKEGSREFESWELFEITLLSTFTLHWFDRKVKDPRKLSVYSLFIDKLKMAHKYAESAADIQRSLVNLSDLAKLESPSLQDLAMWQRDTGAFWKLCERLFNLGIVPGTPPGSSINLTQLFTDKGLADFWETRPLMDGKQLAAFFGVSGPEIRAKQLQLLRWQANNPTANKDDFCANCHR